MPTPPSTPNRLKALRERHGLRQVDVAMIASRDQTVIARYERGETQVPLDILRKLAQHYEVTVEHLMGWDGDEDREPAAA